MKYFMLMKYFIHNIIATCTNKQKLENINQCVCVLYIQLSVPKCYYEDCP